MLKVLSILFLVLMVLVGGERGVKSIITLIGNVLVLGGCIYFLSMGFPVYIIGAAGCIFAILITLLYQNGNNVKSQSAVMANAVVIILLCFFMFFISYNAHMSGLNELELTEDSTMSLTQDIDINMNSIMVIVILFGLLGAVMDTGIAISTAVFEVYQNNKKLGFQDLVKSGWAVGHDILGTTANTLFFAGVGETMMMSILFAKFKYSLGDILNSKIFFQEFSMIIIANIGCLLVIPITAYIVGYLIIKNRESLNSNS